MFERLLIVAIALISAGCGGGTGLGSPGGDRAQGISLEAWVAYRSGNYALADSTFQEALSVAPNLSDALNGRGWANFSLASQEGDPLKRDGFLSVAREYLSRAVAAESENADAWAGLAGVELANDNHQQAVDAALQVVRLNPNYFSPHDNFNIREVRVILATGYFFLGKFSSEEVADPNNAAAQMAILDRTFSYSDPPDLLLKIQEFQAR